MENLIQLNVNHRQMHIVMHSVAEQCFFAKVERETKCLGKFWEAKK